MLPKLNIDLTVNNPDFVYETEFWVVLLSYKQVIPRLVVFPKRYFGTLSEITTEELLDFQSYIVIPIEMIMKNLFQAKVCNWMCLMNGSFQKNNEYQTLLHWHIVGRLDKPISIGALDYEDKYFGHMYDFYQDSKSQEIDGTLQERRELIEIIFENYRRFALIEIINSNNKPNSVYEN